MRYPSIHSPLDEARGIPQPDAADGAVRPHAPHTLSAILSQEGEFFHQEPLIQPVDIPKGLPTERWISKGVEKKNAEAYRISKLKDSRDQSLIVRHQGIPYPAEFGYVRLFNREDGSEKQWSSKSGVPLPFTISMRWRKRKGGIAFSIKWADGREITAKDNVDMFMFLGFLKDGAPSTLFFSANGGMKGMGGYCCSDNSRLVGLGMSLAQTFANTSTTQARLMDQTELLLDDLQDEDYDSMSDYEFVDFEEEAAQFNEI